jgi:glutamate dehydrogenase
MTGTIAAFAPGAAELLARLPSALVGVDATLVAAEQQRLEELGVPADLARDASVWPLGHTAFDMIEVGRARGREVDDVATVWWSVSDRLDVAWLRSQIARLPRNDRWQTFAWAALRDDLLAVSREIVNEVLRGGDRFTPADRLVETWAGANAAGIDRVRQVLADVRAGGVADLTTLSVALRQLRNLVLSAAPMA